MSGSDEPHPYSVRSFTYRAEQVRANEVKKSVNVYSLIQQHISSCSMSSTRSETLRTALVFLKVEEPKDGLI